MAVSVARRYALSIKHRKRIEETFGWAKTVGGIAQTVYRGVERVRIPLRMSLSTNFAMKNAERGGSV